jgi:hypothetical protein
MQYAVTVGGGLATEILVRISNNMKNIATLIFIHVLRMDIVKYS